MSTSQSLRIAAVAIGDELLDGKLVDRNILKATHECRQRGAIIVEIRIVRDEQQAVCRALRDLAAIADVVICSGGLGPTTDDRTRAAFSDATASPLELRSDALERLTQKLVERGRTVAETQKRQAEFPRSAHVIENPWGTADAFEVRLGAARVFALPGVPREFDALFDRDILPLCHDRVAESLRRWAVVGIGEGDIGERVEALGVPAAHTIRYLAASPVVRLEVASREALDPSFVAAVDACVAPWAFARPHDSLAASVLHTFSAARATLSAVESCTGGLISHWATEVAGASASWRGGVVAYTADAKRSLVGVPGDLLARCGTIHPETSVALAERGRDVMASDLAIGVTGVAGPGASEGQEAGTVFVAVASAKETVVAHARFPGRERSDVKRHAASLALRLAALVLTEESELASRFAGVFRIERLAPRSCL